MIDELDLEMLRRKQKLDMQNYKQPAPKWLNIAWDAFRIVDNHSKSMIFQMPDDPRNEDYREYQRVVDKPLSLEAIRAKLQGKYYSTFEEFIADMNTLFNNFIKFRGENHKLYKFCEGVQKRFDKFVEKGRLRANMDS